MLPFKKILFPADFSEQCRGAAHYVVAIAGRFESKVTLLHVSDLPRYNDTYPTHPAARQSALDEFMAKEFEYLPVERLMVEGDPATKILEVARDGQFDLIMLPTHGLGGFRRFLIGSITAKVLHDAECPVWTGVHMDQTPSLEKIAFRHIVCAVDLEPHSREVLGSAVELADVYRAGLTVVHVMPSMESYSDVESSAVVVAKITESLEDLLRSVKAEAEVIVEGGEVAKAVPAVCARQQADLLVIGRTPASGMRLRTHAYSIIRQSPCPVLSV